MANGDAGGFWSSVRKDSKNYFNLARNSLDRTRQKERMENLISDYNKSQKELEILVNDIRIDGFQGKKQQDHLKSYKDLVKKCEKCKNIEDAYKKFSESTDGLHKNIKDYINEKQEELNSAWQKNLENTSNKLEKFEKDINTNYKHLIDKDQQVTSEILKNRLYFARTFRDGIKDEIKRIKAPGQKAMDQAFRDNVMPGLLNDFDRATKEVSNFLDHLKKIDKQEKAKQKDEYEQIKRRLDILVKDVRILGTHGMRQKDEEKHYNSLLEKLDKNNYESANKLLKKLENEWESRIEAFKIPSEVQNKEKRLNEMDEKFEKLRSQDHSWMNEKARETFKSRTALAESFKQKFTNLRQDFDKVGEVSITPVHQRNMDHALAHFDTATKSVQEFLDNQKGKEIRGNIVELTEQLDRVIKELDGLMEDVKIDGFDSKSSNQIEQQLYQPRKNKVPEEKMAFLLKCIQPTTNIENMENDFKSFKTTIYEPLEKMLKDLKNHVLSKELDDELQATNQEINTTEKDSIGKANHLSQELLNYRNERAAEIRKEISELTEKCKKIGEEEDYSKMAKALNRYSLAIDDVKLFLDDLKYCRELEADQDFLLKSQENIGGQNGASNSEEQDYEARLPIHNLLYLQLNSVEANIEKFKEKIKEKYKFTIAINSDLPYKFLNYRVDNLIDVFNAGRQTFRDWQDTPESQREALTEDLKTASSRIKLAETEVQSFFLDVEDLDLSTRLTYANNRFVTLRTWFNNQPEVLRDNNAAYKEHDNAILIALRKARQHEKLFNTAQQQYNTEISNNFNSSVQELEEQVFDFMEFQKELEDPKQASLGDHRRWESR